MTSSRFVFAHLFALVVLALLCSPACADLVDDLLTGKSVLIPAGESGAAATAPDKRAEQGLLSIETQAVNDDTHPLVVKLPVPQVAQASGETFTVESGAPLSLVPEPSAIGLASLALAYFFIFFRRRYA